MPLFCFILCYCTSFSLQAVLNSHYGYQQGLVANRVRAAVMVMIFRKTLLLNSADLECFGTGRVHTMMSVDAERLIGFCTSLHELWSLPLQIIFALWLLYTQVEYAFIAGLLVVLLLIPINKFLARSIQKATGKMMEAKDSRLLVISEFLKGLRTIKSCAWESVCEKRINSHREGELNALAIRKYLDALCVFFWATTTVIFSTLTFTLYAASGKELTPRIVFTSLALFNVLIAPINAFPWVVNGIVEAFVSLRRVEAFLKQSTSREGGVHPIGWYSASDGTISVNNHTEGNGASDQQRTEEALSNLPVHQPSVSCTRSPSTLVVCVEGNVGTGKSTLLKSLLGEVPTCETMIQFLRRCQKHKEVDLVFSYVPQNVWVTPGSIRNNVILGAPFYPRRYEEVLRASALMDDIALMPDKDLTLVGERGSMLSGGQRARVAIARALYRDADVYLFDDILSAVDTQVAEWILKNAIYGTLTRGKIVIVTTSHHTRLNADVKVSVGSDGFVRIAHEIDPEVWTQNKSQESQAPSINPAFASADKVEDEGADHIEPGCLSGEERALVSSDLSSVSILHESETPPLAEMEEEHRAIGHIDWSICRKYMAFQGLWVPMTFVSLLAMQLTRNASDVWLSFWTASSSNEDRSGFLELDGQWKFRMEAGMMSRLYEYYRTIEVTRNKPISFFMTVFVVLAGINAIFTLLRAFSFAQGGLVAARRMHERLLCAVLRLSPSFFISNLSGRILNRFSSDTAAVDDALPFIANIFLAQLFGLLGVIAVLGLAQPYLLPFLLPIGFAYNLLQRYYRNSSRELRRLQAVAASPVYSIFSSALDGGPTIRAFEAEELMMRHAKSAIDNHQRASLALLGASNWLGFRLQSLAAMVASVVTTFAAFDLALPGGEWARSHNPGIVGLSLAYLIPITGLLNGLVTSGAETEQELVAVERIQEYIELPAQPATSMPEAPASMLCDWPHSGEVQFRNVGVYYGSEDSRFAALQDFTLHVEGGSRVGIVGRTGAGKSTALACLLRFVEISSGEILIDGVDIRSVPLHRLRRSIGYLPQETFLFSASVRENVDPLGLFSSEDIVWTLRKVGLYNVLCRCAAAEFATVGQHSREKDSQHSHHRITIVQSRNFDEGILALKLGENGFDLSQGQQQLMSLARILLRRTRLVCLDEAGAGLDANTLELTQSVLNEHFSEATIIEITHRLNKWSKYDMIAIVDGGKVVAVEQLAKTADEDSSIQHMINAINA